MSFPALLLDGVRRAAAHVALLFSLDAPAQPPAPPPAPPAAALAVDGSIAASGLTLVAHHADVRIADGRASVLTLLRLRNDSASEIAAQYRLPHPARLLRDSGSSARTGIDPWPSCDETDLSPEAAERAETAPARTIRRDDVVALAPGEEATLEVLRELPVAAGGGVYRLLLPLPFDRGAPWVPRFTADVLVEAPRPIRRLASPSHRQAQVEGIGSPSALLSLPDGYVYRQAQLIVEFELEPELKRPALALELGKPKR